MRKEFSSWIEQYGSEYKDCIFLTGDLGFAALENVRETMGPRFVNMGVSEQNMISVAAGLAQQGLHPVCYSIAPFAVFRPYEQIRLDVAIHNMPVKIVGNGGGYGYGIMGASHHALEDLAVLSCLPNFECFVPLCSEDVTEACRQLMGRKSPGYLRLGYGVWPKDGLPPLEPFSDVRLILAAPSPPSLTIVGIGPVLLNALPWVASRGDVDVFAVSKLPLADPPELLTKSVKTSKRLFVIEEHAQHGGLGSALSPSLSRLNISFQLFHAHAQGYPNGRYGRQPYHQAQSGLDTDSLKRKVDEILE